MRAGWLTLLLLIVVLVTLTRADSVLTQRMNSLTEQIMKGPTFFGDPIGRMFHTLRQRIDEQQSSWWPNFLYNDPTHPYPRQTENGAEPSFWEETVVDSLKESKDDLLEKFQGLYIPATKDDDEIKSNQTLTKRDSYSMLLHTPIDEPKSQCSGRGQEVGDVKNICQRKDCHATILRCPPNKQKPIDIEDYGAQDLTECQVEEMQCMETTISFTWQYTQIREVRTHQNNLCIK